MRACTPLVVSWCCLTLLLASGSPAQETRPAPLDEPPSLSGDAASRPAPLGRAPGEPATQPATQPAPAAFGAGGGDPLREAGEFVQSYSRDPQPGRVPALVDALQRGGLLARDGGEIGPAAGFLRRVLADNGPALAAWADAWRGYPARDRRALVTMLWAADTDESRAAMDRVAGEELRRYAGDLRARRPAPLAALPFDSPLVLDALWGAWFASGEASYALRVADALPLLGDFNPNDPSRRPTPEELRRFAVGDAARWSLTSNAARDERLLGALRRGLRDAPPEVGGRLARVVAAAEAGAATR